jgi:ligand-binding sensor domain-containing protein
MAILFAGLADCSGQDSNRKFEPVNHFEQTIQPLLERYCVECHAHEGKEAEFLWPKTHAHAVKLRNSFASVQQRLEDGTMPPADSDQPTDLERKLIKDWIDRTFELKPIDFDRLSDYVVETFEDSKGNLWFGTISDGAARYDGKTLTWFSPKTGLGGDTVVSIAEDKQGAIWLGTEGGVSRFDGKDFVTYSNEAGLPGTRCYLLVDRKGTIWVGTERGVFSFNENQFSKFDIPEPMIESRSWKVEFGKVWSLTQDRQGNLWFGRDGLGACRFDGTTFTHYTKRDGLCSNNVSCIVEDKQGNIWLGCLSSDHPSYVPEGGLTRFDGKSFTRFPETKGLSETDIYTIYATKSGDVWVGATGVGAYRYDGNSFTLFDQTDKPYWTRYFGVQSMLEDRRGQLWLGFSGGLFRFNGKSFSNVGKDGPWNESALRKQE